MEKFKFYVHRELKYFVKDTYEIEAESLEDATEMIENCCGDIEECDNAKMIVCGAESERNDGEERVPLYTIIEDEEGEMVWDGRI